MSLKGVAIPIKLQKLPRPCLSGGGRRSVEQFAVTLPSLGVRVLGSTPLRAWGWQGGGVRLG